MHIIPVIDIRHGLAVRAVAGERHNYKPLVSPLAASADPAAVARGYRQLFPFETLYVADLDGIEARGANLDLIQQLAGDWPRGDVWVDSGAWIMGEVTALLAIPNVKAVIGTEGGIAPADFSKLADGVGDRLILSLDFQGDRFLGDAGWLDLPKLWPGCVIVMTLARVGTGIGPDVEKFAALRLRAGPKRRVYAAGGVRARDDLMALRVAGASGALIATALHSGQIKTGDLEETAG